MSKRQGKKSNRNSRHKPQPRRKSRSAVPESEDRRSVAVTVAWMMTTLATVAALVFALGAGLTWRFGREQLPVVFGTLPGTLLLTACLTGTMGLLLTAAALRFRATPPPRPITIGALLIDATPLLILAGLTVAGLLQA